MNSAVQGFLKSFIDKNNSQSNKGDLTLARYYKGHKIEKRNDGRYQARFYINNQQKTIYGKTEKLCLENLKEALNNQDIYKTKTTYFYDYINSWYEVYKKPKQKIITLKTTKGIIENHIKKNIPNININELTPLIINKGLNNITGRPKEYASQYLREMFKQAYKDKIIKIDIYDGIQKYIHNREEGIALTKQQRETLIKICNKTQYGEVILFYLYTGCRKSEALNITNEDIEKDILRIPGTKTKLSDRYIPIFSNLRKIINLLYNKTNKKLIPISDTTIKRKVEEIRKLCGFHFNIKDLRTTFGTMCAEAGINDSIIAKWLGHTNTNTTKKYYIKILSDFEKENISKFDTCFDT